MGCLNATSSTICFLGAFVGFCVGRYWMAGGGGGGGDGGEGGVTGVPLMLSGVTWGGRYTIDPGITGIEAPGVRGGFGTVRDSSSLTSSSLSCSRPWFRESSTDSCSRVESRATSSSSGSSFTGFITCCVNGGAFTGKFGRTSRNVPGASSPRLRGLKFYYRIMSRRSRIYRASRCGLFM